MNRKIVILSTQRSGTNYLRGSLNKTTEFRTRPILGEVFNYSCVDKIAVDSKRSLFGGNQLTIPNPFAFTRMLFKKGCSGFVLFADKETPDGYLNWLSEKDDVLILHLKRRNRAKGYVSLMVAQKYGIWSTEEVQETPRKIKVDPYELFVYLRNCEKREEIYDIYCDDAIITEDLDEGLISEFVRKYGFGPIDGFPKTKKCNPFKIRDIIENFDEVLNHRQISSRYRDMLLERSGY